jgi:hypothetical protein
LLTGTTAQRFTATGAPIAAKRLRILLMNRHAGWPIIFGTSKEHVVAYYNARFENVWTKSSTLFSILTLKTLIYEGTNGMKPLGTEFVT